MAFDSFFGGIRRRRSADVDPYSDAARFPTLVERDSNALSGAVEAIRDGQLGGAGSIAARFDPRDKGSIFSRQFGGAAEALRDQQRQADPSNNYYNGDSGVPAPTSGIRNPLSAIDRYAALMGYQADGSQKPVAFNSITNNFDAGVSGLDIDRAGIRRKRPFGSPDFGVY